MKQWLIHACLTGIVSISSPFAPLGSAQEISQSADPQQTGASSPDTTHSADITHSTDTTNSADDPSPPPAAAKAKEKQRPETPAKTWSVKKLANLDYTRVPNQRDRADETTQQDPPAQQNREQRCDLFLPVESISAGQDSAGKDSAAAAKADKRKSSFPVVVLVHGGAWVAGDKWNMERHARHLAANGYAALNINYRLSPGVKFPSHLDDLRLALCWLKANAGRYQLDVDRVGLYGYSAGAHLVSLLGCLQDEPAAVVQKTSLWQPADPRWGQLPRIQAVLAGGPPTDFRQVPERGTFYQFFLGGTRQQVPEQYRLASPAEFTSMQDPPICLVQGESDLLVSCKQTVSFAGQCKRAGIDVTLITLPNHGHMTTFLSGQLNQALLDFFGDRL